MSFPSFLDNNNNNNSPFSKVFVVPKIITLDFKLLYARSVYKRFYLPFRQVKRLFKNLNVYLIDSMTMLNLAPLQSTVPVKCLLHNSGKLFVNLTLFSATCICPLIRGWSWPSRKFFAIFKLGVFDFIWFAPLPLQFDEFLTQTSLHCILIIYLGSIFKVL